MTSLETARSAALKSYAYRSTHREYYFAWRGGGSVTVVGEANAAQRLRISVASLRVYLSQGKTWLTPSPLTGEPDVMSVTKGPTPQDPSKTTASTYRPAKHTGVQPKRGRPPKAAPQTEHADPPRKYTRKM